jgi:uncharacterized protein YjbI with pentapeptide repeats
VTQRIEAKEEIMSESPEPRDELREMREALARARAMGQMALIGLVFAVGLMAALVVPAKTTNVNLRGQLMLNVRPRGADLQGVEMRGTRLTNANMAGVDLAAATLTDVDLSGANLAGASLRGARLRDVDLSDANLTGADVTGTVYDIETRWPADFDPQPRGAVLKR